MTKKAYIGVNNVARQVKKGYIGVDGVARKIKKAYIGVGGVARPCWSGGELTYYGKTSQSFNYAVRLYAGGSIGDYALFAGGVDSNGTYRNTVNAYNKQLVKSNPTPLSSALASLASANVGDYLLFASGTVNAYNTLLTRTIPEKQKYSNGESAGASIGDYALFGGGADSDGYTINTVDVYDATLTHTNPVAIFYQVGLGAAANEKYAIFAGGGDTTPINGVVAISSSLTRTVPSSGLSNSVKNCAGGSIGVYALFAGGDKGGAGSYSTVDAYDGNLTRIVCSSLANARAYLTSTSIGDYALFGGGVSNLYASNTNYYATVDVYDKNLTKTTTTNLSSSRWDLESASIGDYALFGGGRLARGYTSDVDVYTIA